MRTSVVRPRRSDERGLDDRAASGSLQAQVPSMQTRARLYEPVDYAAYSAFDARVATFDLTNNRSEENASLEEECTWRTSRRASPGSSSTRRRSRR